MTKETRAARKLWDLGWDTLDIAERMNIPESRAYNIISRRHPKDGAHRVSYAGASE